MDSVNRLVISRGKRYCVSQMGEAQVIFLKVVKPSHDIVMMSIQHYAFVKTHRLL